MSYYLYSIITGEDEYRILYSEIIHAAIFGDCSLKSNIIQYCAKILITVDTSPSTLDIISLSVPIVINRSSAMNIV